MNLVARHHGDGPGRRMVFNGHLDTFPSTRRCPGPSIPLGGLVRDGRLYGRGAAT